MKFSNRIVCSKLLKVFEEKAMYETLEIGKVAIHEYREENRLYILNPKNIRRDTTYDRLLIDCDVIYMFIMADDWARAVGGTDEYNTYTFSEPDRGERKIPVLDEKYLMLVVNLLHTYGANLALKKIEERICQLIRTSEN